LDYVPLADDSGRAELLALIPAFDKQ
jgi:hypothetical protein